MTSFSRQMASVISIVALAALALAPAAFAGDYHSGAALRCSDCHIMHGSHNGTPYNSGSGFTKMLKFGSNNALCLSCHDGTDATAPDVVSTGTATSATTTNDTLGINYASPYKNSAGYFQSDYATLASNYGHNLVGPATQAPGGTWTCGANGMNCTDCHDPHGGANYRNLKTQPGNAGAPIQVRGGVSGTQEVYLKEAITIPATATDTATHYNTDAVHFNDPNNLTHWCEGCHENIETGNKHVQDVPITSGAGKVDSAHWESGTGVGFGAAVDYTASTGDHGIPRVRFATVGTSYADLDTKTVTPVAANDKIFCLTCHKAHGSRVDSGLVWPYFTSSTYDRTAACDQCHNKGG